MNADTTITKIKEELEGIDLEELTKAEKNILKHIKEYQAQKDKM